MLHEASASSHADRSDLLNSIPSEGSKTQYLPGLLALALILGVLSNAVFVPKPDCMVETSDGPRPVSQVGRTQPTEVERCSQEVRSGFSRAFDIRIPDPIEYPLGIGLTVASAAAPIVMWLRRGRSRARLDER